MTSSARHSTQATRTQADEGRHLANELRKRVSGEVRFDPFSRYLYSTDASMYQMDPVGVVVPRSVEDVLAVMEVASQHKTPVLARCGGTSLAGQTVNHAIVMDFTKYMSRVIALNEEEGWARVEPGIVLDELNRIAAPFGLKYAPDPRRPTGPAWAAESETTLAAPTRWCTARPSTISWSSAPSSPTEARPISGRWTKRNWSPSSPETVWNLVYTEMCCASGGKTGTRSWLDTPKSCVG